MINIENIKQIAVIRIVEVFEVCVFETQQTLARPVCLISTA